MHKLILSTWLPITNGKRTTSEIWENPHIKNKRLLAISPNWLSTYTCGPNLFRTLHGKGSHNVPWKFSTRSICRRNYFPIYFLWSWHDEIFISSQKSPILLYITISHYRRLTEVFFCPRNGHLENLKPRFCIRNQNWIWILDLT